MTLCSFAENLFSYGLSTRPISNPEKRPTRTHRRNAFPPESHRIMHRTKIKGDKPI